MQFLGVTFQAASGGIAGGRTEAEQDFNRRVWESQRAVTGEGIENPFEIFQRRGEYIDRTQNGGGLEPWEFGYQEPQAQSGGGDYNPGWWPDWIPDLGVFDDAYRRGTEGGSLGTVPQDESGGGFNPLDIEWPGFFTRVVYVIIGIVLLGIGAAALGSQAVNNPLTRTIQQAQRFVS